MEQKFHINYNKKTNRVGFLSICATILFFLMIVFPQTYQQLKAPFLLIVGISIIFGILLIGKIRIESQVALWFYVYMIYGVVWGGLGVFNSKEYAIDFLRLYAGWVFIYMFLVVMISKPSYIEKAQKIMIWSAFVIAIININYFLYGKGTYYIPFLTTLDMGQSIMGQSIGIHSGYSQISNLSIGSLFFLVPFIFSRIIINRGKNNAETSNTFKIFVLLLCLLTVFLSGRRMLIYTIALMPIVYIFAIVFSKSDKINFKIFTKIIISASMVFSTIIYIFYQKMGWNFQELIDRLTFSGRHGVGTVYRINRSKEMITEVYEHNLFWGTGGGSRNFEVTFIKTFHETGVAGLIVNLSLYIWVFIMILIIIRRRNELKYQGIPLFVGSICFFIAMFSNPFASFDFMWTLFLPVAFINTYLTASKKRK